MIIQNGGGTSGPTVPPAPAAAAGEIFSSQRISTGTFLVRAASIHTANAYDEECRISVITDDGIEICLGSGFVSQNRPFALEYERTVTGPGYLRGYVEALEATTMSFTIALDKVLEQEGSRPSGGFGRWF